MDERVWYLGVGTLAAAFVAMLIDAFLTSFNVDPGYYPFLGVFAGAVFGAAVAAARSRGKNGDETPRD